MSDYVCVGAHRLCARVRVRICACVRVHVRVRVRVCVSDKTVICFVMQINNLWWKLFKRHYRTLLP